LAAVDVAVAVNMPLQAAAQRFRGTYLLGGKCNTFPTLREKTPKSNQSDSNKLIG
jgi:hypothetical protein